MDENEGVRVNQTNSKDETKDVMKKRTDSSNQTGKETCVVLSQAERSKRFGIECTCLGVRKSEINDGVIFVAGSWTPGGEYVRKFLIRNVSTDIKKVKYTLPASRYFGMDFPEVITLVPGGSREVMIIFRPVQSEPYDDTIFIKVLEGLGTSSSSGFHLPVRAFIDKLLVKVTPGVDFGYIATHQSSTTTFQLSNVGSVNAPFRWECPSPFIISPEEGVLSPGQSLDMIVRVFPTDATVFVSKAICFIGEGVSALIPEPIISTHISCIGKYPFIVLSENVVDFGEICNGVHSNSHQLEKEVVLRNNGVVPAEFDLVRHDSDGDETFDIYPKKGIIDGKAEISIFIRFKPLASGVTTVDRYSFVTPSNCRTTLTCRGSVTPPKINIFKELSGVNATYSDASPKESVNFNDLEIGRRETRLITLSNDSDYDVPFNVVCGEGGIFIVSPMVGVIPGKLQVCLTISFAPTLPINFYRRFFILLQDTSSLFFDVMGSGFIRANGEVKECRPAPMRHAHIQAYKNRLQHGIGHLSPDELDSVFQILNGSIEETDTSLNNSVMTKFSALSSSQQQAMFALVGRSGTAPLAIANIMDPLTRSGEMTRSAIAPMHEFFLEDTGFEKEGRVVRLDHSFLEFGYTSYNSSSESKIITIHNMTNSKVNITWKLPSANVQGTELTDHSNNFSNSEEDKAAASNVNFCAFRCEPPMADCVPMGSVKFKIIFHPKQADRNYFTELEAIVYFKNQRTFRLVNDLTLTPPWILTTKVSGNTFSSGQLIGNLKLTGNAIRKGKLVFPTCYDGDTMYQTIMLKNNTNLPSTFKFEIGWDSSESVGGGFGRESIANTDQVFSIKPQRGEVSAEGFVLVCVRFKPSAIKKYSQLLRCIVNGSFNGCKLLLEGSCGVPFIVYPEISNVENSFVGIKATIARSNIPKGFLGEFYLQPTCVGLTSSRSITIKNGSRLPIRYRIYVPSTSESIICLSQIKGILRGNEEQVLVISFAPRAVCRYEFKIKVKTFPIGGKPSDKVVVDSRQFGKVDSPECLQTISFNIIAPADCGAIVFDPPRFTPPVCLVDTMESGDIFLENASNVDVQYSLYYIEEFTEDDGNSATRCVTSVPRLMHSQDEVSASTSTNTVFIDDQLLCQFPSGIISARSRKKVKFVFSPSKSGLFEFAVHCKVQAVDSKGNPVQLSNTEAYLLHDTANSASSEGFDNLMNQLTLVANVTGRASYPTLICDDIRTSLDDTLLSDVEQLWKHFSIPQINYDLSLPLTKNELYLNKSATAEELLAQLKRYQFRFIPDVIGSPIQTLFLRLTNKGFLTTTFSQHWPNEKELELETWCDVDDATEEVNQMIDIVENLQLFSLEPKSAVLQPGESCVIKLTYSHSSLKYNGIHRIPILMKVDKGKQFYIDLFGQTLSPSLLNDGINNNDYGIKKRQSTQKSSSLQIMREPSSTNSSSSYELIGPVGTDGIYQGFPVPIGVSTTDAVRQKIEIVNVSAFAVDFEIDQTSINSLNDLNYGLFVVRIENVTGKIEARSSVSIEILFSPLEEKLYQFDLKVKYSPSITKTSLSGATLLESTLLSPSKTIEEVESELVIGVADVSRSIVEVVDRPATRKQPRLQRHATSSTKVVSPLGYPPKYLQFSVHLRGYDPRNYSTAPPPVVSNMIMAPPSVRRLVVDNQLATFSTDILSFGYIPQYCTAHQLIVVRNLSMNFIDYSVDIDSLSSLINSGLLEISPIFGKIRGKGVATIDVKIVANSKASYFAERIKFSVREIINYRRGGVSVVGALQSSTAKMNVNKAEIKQERTSVISKITAARTASLRDVEYFDGRVPNFPTTLDSLGRLTKTASAVPEDRGGDMEDKSFLAEPLAHYNRSVDASFSILPQSTVLRSRTAPGSSRQHRNSSGDTVGASSSKSEGLTPSLRSQNNRPMSSGSRISSSSSSLAKSSEKILLGPTQTFHIRLQGNIISFAMEKFCKNVFKGFVVPATKPYLADPTFLSDSNNSNSNSKMSSSSVSQRNVVFTPYIDPLLMLARETELRNAVETSIQFIFRDLFDDDIGFYLAKVIEMEGDVGLSPPDQLLLENPPRGNASYGINFCELKQQSVQPENEIVDKIEENKIIKYNNDEDIGVIDVEDTIINNNNNNNSNNNKDADDDEEKNKITLIKAIESEGFVDLTREILRNTFFNIMQEAANDEFSVEEYPLVFSMKK